MGWLPMAPSLRVADGTPEPRLRIARRGHMRRGHARRTSGTAGDAPSDLSTGAPSDVSRAAGDPRGRMRRSSVAGPRASAHAVRGDHARGAHCDQESRHLTFR
jgi:hypothetical protein